MCAPPSGRSRGVRTNREAAEPIYRQRPIVAPGNHGHDTHRPRRDTS
jgi:hypothetical protein